MKLTGWYFGDQTPVRKGVYERLYDEALGINGFCYWDGESWAVSSSTVKGAIKFKKERSADQNMPWRGTIKESK